MRGDFEYRTKASAIKDISPSVYKALVTSFATSAGVSLLDSVPAK